MAYYDQVFYCNAGDQSTTGHYAVAKRPQNAAVTAGQLVRQFTAPAVGNERVFVCIVAGTTANVTDATWVLTRAGLTTDGTASWREITGVSAVNGDAANTVTWAVAKAIGAPSIGAVIKRNNGASYQICTTAGSVGVSEPAFSDTAGVTTNDGGTVWTSLGPVGNFTGGQAPHARLAAACATNWFAVGNTIYVGDNHAESQATAITIAPALSTASVGRIICHNHSGGYPPASADLRITATISTTATAVALTFSPTAGGIYIYGIAFIAGAGVSVASNTIILTPNAAFYYFDNCAFKIANTANSALDVIQVNTTLAGVVVWNNCTVSFGHVNNYIDVGTVNFTWQNTGPILASGSAVPTGLLGTSAGGRLGNIVLEALDLSQLTGSLDKQVVVTEMGNWLIKDCKLNASMTIPTPQTFGQTIQLVRSDSSGTAYKSARYQYEGTETTETSITRVGGASDPTGQAQSRKIVTTANLQWLRPFKAEPYAIWNPTTAANVTVTVYGTINAGALPNNDDIWLEVEYLGSALTPIGTIVTTTKANVLAANAAVASDGSTWNNTPNTFDPSTTTNTTLSNGNLTATHNTTTTSSGAQVASSIITGKYYFEVTQTTTGHGLNDTIACIAPVGTAYGAVVSSAVGIGQVNRGGSINANNVSTGQNIGTFAAGDVCGCAVDVGAELIWFRRNNGNWNNSGTANPATGVGGFTFSSIPQAVTIFVGFGGSGTAIGDSYTINLGATSYANAAPSGFGNWVSWTPFKLVATLSSPQPGMAGYLYARVRVAKPSVTIYVDPQITLS